MALFPDDEENLGGNRPLSPEGVSASMSADEPAASMLPGAAEFPALPAQPAPEPDPVPVQAEPPVPPLGQELQQTVPSTVDQEFARGEAAAKRKADAEAKAAAAAEKKQAADENRVRINTLKSQGVKFTVNPETGSMDQPETRDDGSMVYHPAWTSAPKFDPDKKTWVRDKRDETGTVTPIDLRDNGDIKLEPKSGELYFEDGGVRHVIGKDDGYLRKKAIGDEVKSLYEANANRQLESAQARLDLNGILEPFKEKEKELKTAQQLLDGPKRIAETNPDWLKNPRNAEILRSRQEAVDNLSKDPLISQHEALKTKQRELDEADIVDGKRRLALITERNALVAASNRPEFAAPPEQRPDEMPDAASDRQTHGIGGDAYHVPYPEVVQSDFRQAMIHLDTEAEQLAPKGIVLQPDPAREAKLAEINAERADTIKQFSGQIAAAGKFHADDQALNLESARIKGAMEGNSLAATKQMARLDDALASNRLTPEAYHAQVGAMERDMQALALRKEQIDGTRQQLKKQTFAALQTPGEFPESLINREGAEADLDPRAVSVRAAGRAAAFGTSQGQELYDTLLEIKDGGKIQKIGGRPIADVIKDVGGQVGMKVQDLLTSDETKTLQEGLRGGLFTQQQALLHETGKPGIPRETPLETPVLAGAKTLAKPVLAPRPQEFWQQRVEDPTVASPVAKIDISKLPSKDQPQAILEQQRDEIAAAPLITKEQADALGWKEKSPEQKQALIVGFQTMRDLALQEQDRKISGLGEDAAQSVKDRQGITGFDPAAGLTAGNLSKELGRRVESAKSAAMLAYSGMGTGFLESITFAADLLGANPETFPTHIMAKRATDFWTGRIADEDRNAVFTQVLQNLASAHSFMAVVAPVGAVAEGTGLALKAGEIAGKVLPFLVRGKTAVQIAELGSNLIGAGGAGAIQQAGGSYAEAIEMGMTPAQRKLRYALNLPIGATEAAGIGGIFNRLDRIAGGTLTKFFVNLLKEGVEEGAQEFSQEVLSDVADLIIMKKDDPRRKEWGAIVSDALQGGTWAGVTGALFAGMSIAAESRDQRHQKQTSLGNAKDALSTLDSHYNALTEATQSEPALAKFNSERQQKWIDLKGGEDNGEAKQTEKGGGQEVLNSSPAGKPGGAFVPLTMEKANDLLGAVGQARNLAALHVMMHDDKAVEAAIKAVDSKADTAAIMETMAGRPAVLAQAVALGQDFAPLVAPGGGGLMVQPRADDTSRMLRHAIIGHMVLGKMEDVLKGGKVSAKIGQALEAQGYLIQKPTDKGGTRWVLTHPGLELMDGEVRAMVAKNPKAFQVDLAANTAQPGKLSKAVQADGDGAISLSIPKPAATAISPGPVQPGEYGQEGYTAINPGQAAQNPAPRISGETPGGQLSTYTVTLQGEPDKNNFRTQKKVVVQAAGPEEASQVAISKAQANKWNEQEPIHTVQHAISPDQNAGGAYSPANGNQQQQAGSQASPADAVGSGGQGVSDAGPYGGETAPNVGGQEPGGTGGNPGGAGGLETSVAGPSPADNGTAGQTSQKAEFSPNVEESAAGGSGGDGGIHAGGTGGNESALTFEALAATWDNHPPDMEELKGKLQRAGIGYQEDTSRPTSVRPNDDGTIVFHLNPEDMNGPIRRRNAAVSEEIKHLGTMLAERDAWISAGGKQGTGQTFNEFLHARAKELFDDLVQRTMALTPGEQKAVANALVGSYNSYFWPFAGFVEAKSGADVKRALDREFEPGHAPTYMGFIHELARQISQLRDEGSITEATQQGILAKIIDYITKGVAALKKFAASVREGAFAGSKLDSLIARAEQELRWFHGEEDMPGDWGFYSPPLEKKDLRGKTLKATEFTGTALLEFISGRSDANEVGDRPMTDSALERLARYFDGAGRSKDADRVRGELAQRAMAKDYSENQKAAEDNRWELREAILDMGGINIGGEHGFQLRQMHDQGDPVGKGKGRAAGVFKVNEGHPLDVVRNNLESRGFKFKTEDDLLSALERMLGGERIIADPIDGRDQGRGEAIRVQPRANLAPNGQPSSLTEEEFVVAHSPEFKAQFGDWVSIAEDAAWKTRVDDYFKNPHQRDVLTVGSVPEVLRAVGVSANRLVMPPSVIRKVTGEKHTLTREMVEQIPNALRDPIFVFESASELKAITVLTEIRSGGINVLAAIHLDSSVARGTGNVIVSLHERPVSQVTTWIKSGLLLYSNQQKARSYFRSARLQLPREGSKAGNKTILTEADVVNRSVNPDSVSVLLDKNGEPSKETVKAFQEGKKPHDKNSTQINISGPVADEVRAFGESIPENEIYHGEEGLDSYGSDGYGRETEPHVTVLYGIEATPAQVEAVGKKIGPVTLELGKTSLFENADKPYDVLKVDIKGGGIRILNRALNSAYPVKSDFPDYRPHMTIAYLKKGEGVKYSGDARFEGKTITANDLEFSAKDRSKIPVPLQVQPRVDANQTAFGFDEVTGKAQPGFDFGSRNTEAPRATVKESLTTDRPSPTGTITDFGEKIGGARKDTSIKTGQTGQKASDERPAWARRYQISQIIKSTDAGEESRWSISDLKNTDWMGNARQIGDRTYATKEEAEVAIPLIAVARNHDVRMEKIGPEVAPKVDPGAQVESDMKRIAEIRESEGGKLIYSLSTSDRIKKALELGTITQADYDRAAKLGSILTPEKAELARAAQAEIDSIRNAPFNSRQPEGEYKYTIWKKVSDTKRVQVVPTEFKTREDAMRYMAEHAAEILDTKTVWREELFAKPEKAVREGKPRREGLATSEMFQNTFGFRGVEFGNWMRQEGDGKERQEVLNHAFDGLLDLADVLGIPAKAISLNGELALAFGARGQGLQGAKAHYERDYAVINLTKMSGAGSLAHEWFHGFDHYLARLDGKAAAQMVANTGGDMVFPSKGTSRDLASHGFGFTSKVREAVRAAYKQVIQTIFNKAVQYVEDSQKAEKFVKATRDNLTGEIKSLRDDLTRSLDPTYYKRNNKPATEEQIAEFDRLTNNLIEGKDLETEYRYNNTGDTPARKRGAMSGRWSNDTLDAIGAIYKAVRGRSGFNSEQTGRVDHIRGYLKNYSQRIAMLESAAKSEEKTKMVPTEFAMNAKRIDQGSATDYWTTPHEMAARAFSAYVEDKISEQGGKSDFLSYGSDNSLPEYRMWNLRPFPEGAERVEINKALDNLFSTLETKETEKGTALYAQPKVDQNNASQQNWFGFGLDVTQADTYQLPLTVADGMRGATKDENALFHGNIGLAYKIAGDYGNLGDLADMRQEALIALTRAVRVFDPAKGKFSTLAGTIIRNHLNGLYRDRDKLHATSLDAELGDSGQTLEDVTAGQDESPAMSAQRREAVSAVQEVLARLPADLRAVMTARMAGQTQEEIGKSRGVTKQTISNMEKAAMGILRTRLKAKGIDGIPLRVQPRFNPNQEDFIGKLNKDIFPSHFEADHSREPNRTLRPEELHTMTGEVLRDVHGIADQIENTPPEELSSDKKTTLRDQYNRHLRGRFDKLNYFAQGSGQVLLDAQRDNAHFAAAMRLFTTSLDDKVKAAFGYPSFWRNRENLDRLKRFKAEILPYAAALNPTSRDGAGDLVFQDFWQRHGELSGKQVEAMGRAPGDEWVDHATSDRWRIGEFVIPDPKKPQEGFYQLERFLPAAAQDAIHEDFHDRFPESAFLLDDFIEPGMESERVVSPQGIKLPTFNRHSLFGFYGDTPAGLVQKLPGYTPDVTRTKSIAGMAAKVLKLNWKSPGRDYKSGQARITGQVRDLFQGFNVRAAQAHMETTRRDMAEMLLRATMKPVPADGLPTDYVRLDRDTLNPLVRAMREASKLNQANMPEIMAAATDQLTKRDLQTLEFLFGDPALFDPNQMIHNEVLAELNRGFVRLKLDNAVLDGAMTWIRGSVAGVLADFQTIAINKISNYIFHAMRVAQRTAYAGLSAAAGDKEEATRAIREAGFHVQGFFTNFYHPEIRERMNRLVPPETFEDQNVMRQILGENQDMSVADMLKQLNVGGALLKAVGYGDMDTHSKQKMALASMLARASIAADEANITGPERKAWMHRWVEDAPVDARREAELAAKLYLHDYANVPWWLDNGRQIEVGGHDVTPWVNFVRALAIPFWKYPYNYLRQMKRLSVDSGRTLFSKEFTGREKREAGANLISLAMLMSAYFLMAKPWKKDDDEILGRDLTDTGEEMDPKLRTESRVRLANSSLIGMALGTATKMFGAEAENNDLWVRVRTMPYATQALALGAALRYVTHPSEGGAKQSVSGAWNMIEDFMSIGSGARLGATFLGYRDEYTKNQTAPFMISQTAFDMATGRVILPRVTKDIAQLIDPINRRQDPSASLGYEPGAVEGLLSKIPGATTLLPPSGKITVGSPGSVRAIDARERLEAMGLGDKGYREYLDKKGKLRAAWVNPDMIYKIPAWKALVRQIGFNVKPVPREQYQNALAGIED